ncbi:MAG TPA: beta-propeller fold lactonase family protein [Leptospiraceae bacterium]|nr:beta-propeller fold lactonase family protein [Leptospiraceae bacterium]HNE24372.1 beta-propeller fold lactonase family protein [Leptospiraceae bacterium]HNJ02668.1 beta-propeller fold lactonase family protein [Leptospiraceae bacterium]HNJ35027.1 beta-propeller fold lactonase family protein [Leptospiraceae bacterium]HNN60806.1 beta-propeller fold lactonase family protein [Leptospiraceae bacterium]
MGKRSALCAAFAVMAALSHCAARSECSALDISCSLPAYLLMLQSRQFAYIANASTFEAFRYDQNTSQLTLLQTVASGQRCDAVRPHPYGVFLHCVVDVAGTDYLRVFRIGSGGVLSFIEEFNIGSVTGLGLANHHRGDIVVLIVDTFSRYYLYQMDQITGHLTLASQSPAGVGGAASAMSRDGNFIYGRTSGASQVTLRITGNSITQMQDLGNPGTNTFTFTTTPDGFYQLQNINQALGIRRYTVNGDGTLSAPLDYPNSAQSEIFDDDSWTPDGRFFYTRSGASADNLRGYAYSGGNINLVTGTPIVLPGGLGTPTVDPGGKYVFIDRSAAGLYHVFQINRITGELTQMADSPRACTSNPCGRISFGTRARFPGDF